ncbi:hypothetical protein CEXT_70591 [Caerostris extrusa]|uniref:Uncharacterized protein n=1 Tax=Caerostris extrusa TaxID=172846 RepID=A0AAV4M3R2_CAEEX|nr:hypothetical protein CEXT_70591 [Caerostris extrusa]
MSYSFFPPSPSDLQNQHRSSPAGAGPFQNGVVAMGQSYLLFPCHASAVEFVFRMREGNLQLLESLKLTCKCENIRLKQFVSHGTLFSPPHPLEVHDVTINDVIGRPTQRTSSTPFGRHFCPITHVHIN